jgi:type I restriction enzyme S subunit
MKNGWPVRKFGDLADQITDGTHNSPPYVDSGIPMLDSKHVKDGFMIDDTEPEKFISPSTDAMLAMRCKPRAGDILISSRGSIGKIAIVREGQDFNIMGNMILIRLPGAVSRNFAAFYLHSQINHIESIARGVAQKGLYLNQVRDYEIPLPSLPEQHRIVGILDKAFEGIATVKANAEKNLQNARAVFESRLNAILSCRNGWKEKSFSEVCEISSVLVDPRRKEFLDLLHVGGANIVSKTGELIDLQTSREEELISGKFLFDETMVLYSKIRPYLVKVARPGFRGLCSADIYPLSAKVGELDCDYLFYVLLSRDFTEYAITGSARAGMPKVNRDHLFSFRVHIPPLETQKKFAAVLGDLQTQTQHLESIYQQKIAALDELKKSLLHQAFTGGL